jgi:uncharacterized protein YhaN
MLITRLYLNYFGKFSGKEIKLSSGVNLIYGENEAGKSTIHTFIRGMLFGIERLRGRGAATKDDVYTRYLPWDYPGAYGGQMDIKLGDKEYRLDRSFHANDKSFTLTDLSTGRELKLKEGHISELIPGLTESTYRNTISIEQLRAETDSELAAQVRNYITNLSITKSKELDVEKALGLLKEKKKVLESMSYNNQLKALSEEIKEGEVREERIERLTASLKELKDKELVLRKELKEHKSSENQREEELIAQLPAILEKYRSYLELTKQYSQINTQLEALQDKLTLYKQNIENLNKKQEANKAGLTLKGLIYTALSVMAGFISYITSRSIVVSVAILLAALFAGVAVWTISNRRKLAAVEEERLKIELSLKHGKDQEEDLLGRRKKLEDDCDRLHDTIMLYMQEFISEDELTLQAIERLKEVIGRKKKETFERQNKQNEILQEYNFQIGKISLELSQLENNETELIKNKEQYAYLMQKQKENELELNALNLAIDTIEELSVNIHDSFGLQLNDAVSNIIDSVTGHKYRDIKIDERLNIKLGWNDRYVLLDRLSAGTIDQVYFALRMAVCDLLLGKEPMPLILDDSFVLYDDNRVKAVLSEIAGGRQQVILFSCQKRERQIIEELGLPYNYIQL